MSKKITIDFCGSVSIDPKKVKFIDVETEDVIDGAKYNRIKNKENYVIQDMSELIKIADDIDWLNIDVM